MELSTRIRQARKVLGLTGAEAAVRWGVNRRSLENWEQGRRLPRGIALEAIEQRIAVSLVEAKPALSTFGVPGFAGSPRCHARNASAAQRALTTPATRPVTVPTAGLALAMPKCWQPAITPAMRLAAAAADERERLGTWQDEEADFARRCAGAGFVEFTLATEGN